MIRDRANRSSPLRRSGPRPRLSPLAQYATQARTEGSVAALHSAGLVLAAIALAGALGALGLPSARNTAMMRG